MSGLIDSGTVMCMTSSSTDTAVCKVGPKAASHKDSLFEKWSLYKIAILSELSFIPL